MGRTGWAFVGLAGVVAAWGCGGYGVINSPPPPPPPPPPPNVRIAVSPTLSGTFSGQPGAHQFTATVTDTLGNPLSGLTVVWTVQFPNAGIAVDQTGQATVPASATPGDYFIVAKAMSSVGENLANATTRIRVLPRPAGKLYFATANGLYVKDFANDLDATPLTTPGAFINGFDVDPVQGVIVFGRGTDVFRMNTDGTGLTPLTSDGTANSGPFFHPITGEIYFSRRAPGATVTDIWKMARDGSGKVQLTTGTQNKLTVAVSRDGSRVA